MSDQPTQFLARPLFSLEAQDMGRNVLRHAGPMGTRSVASPNGGEVSGPRVTGRLAPGLAGEWQLACASQPGLAYVEGLITIDDDGGAILMKYNGRRAPRYGESGWRICAEFEAPADGSYDWLNDLLAVGEVQRVGHDLRFTVGELLSEPTGDAAVLTTEPLYEMDAYSAVGHRRVIPSPIATRYMTIAEEGCQTQGRLGAKWPVGFAWGAHRTARSAAGEFAAVAHRHAGRVAGRRR